LRIRETDSAEQMTRILRKPPTQHAARADHVLSTNRAFDDFLQLTTRDRKLLTRYRPTLMRGGERFARVFYDYLLAFPATAEVLKKFQKRGGNIENLVRRQMAHLSKLLSGEPSVSSDRRLAHIGAIHHRHGIEPAWMLGAYRLYLNHLQALVRRNPSIADKDRAALEASLIKILFRDMGLALEGFWQGNLSDLQREKTKVGELQAQVTSLLANIPQVLWSVDVASNRAVYVSPSTEDISMADTDLPIPSNGPTLAKDRRKLRQAWNKALSGERVEVDSRVRQPDGEVRWFRRTLCPFVDTNGDVTRVDGVMEDATDSKHMVQKLHTLATTDSLTGLPNRALFKDRFKQALHAAARRNREVVLVLIDLDHFKEINDTLGHPAGDQVLTLIGQRLSTLLRASDTVARLGGDEFAVLLPDVPNGRKTAARFLKKMLKSFDSPLKVGDNELFLRTGIGVAVYPEHGGDAATLMNNADVAMYGTKNRDVDYLFYDNAPTPNGSEHADLLGDLHHAIQQRELVLHYQPQIDVRQRRVVGVEALVRWNHPQHGLMTPKEFLPVAERSGFICALTYWVLNRAARQCAHWQRAGWSMRVTVNVSPRALRDPDFFERTRQILRNANIAAPWLEIEITESALLNDFEHIRAVLLQLAALGVRIAIDNFGSDHSSLAPFEKLSVNTLKIDSSFIQRIVADKRAATVARSALELGRDFGCTLIAAGVENRITWERLSQLGCDHAQGFLVSKPLTPDALDAWLIGSPWNSGSNALPKGGQIISPVAERMIADADRRIGSSARRDHPRRRNTH